MLTRNLLCALAILAFCTTKPAQAQDEGVGTLPSASSPGDDVGTLPKATTGGSEGIGSLPRHKGTALPYEPTGGGSTRGGDTIAKGKEKVKPGESHKNEDGVELTNDEDSSGDATIDPEHGDDGSSTTVDTKTGFEGSVTGIDANDVVDLGSSNTASVAGTGGTVVMSGGSNVTVTNTTPAGTVNADVITIDMPSGTKLTVHPGSSITVET